MIKKHHIIASIILLFCTEIHAQSWTLLWEDEFNSTTLDSNYWSHDIGSGSQFNLCHPQDVGLKMEKLI